MNFNLFKKLSLVIPTNNRPYALKRVIEYLKSLKFSGQVFVLDSSNKIKKKNNFYSYYYFPGKNANLKISSILNKLKTKYTLILADDDLIIPEGILQSIKFLEKKNNFIGAHGLYYNHSIKNLFIFNLFKYLQIRYPFFHSYLNKKISINRAFDYLDGKYAPLNYAIFKTNFFKKVWKKATLEKSQDNIFLETVPCFLFYYYGSVKCLKIPYLTRERSFRTKPQIEFTDKKGFKLALSFLMRVISNSKVFKNNNLNILKKKFEYRKNREEQKMLSSKKNFILQKIFFRLKNLRFYFIGNKKFRKDILNKYILKYYNKVLNEVDNTQMK